MKNSKKDNFEQYFEKKQIQQEHKLLPGFYATNLVGVRIDAIGQVRALVLEVTEGEFTGEIIEKPI